MKTGKRTFVLSCTGGDRVSVVEKWIRMLVSYLVSYGVAALV